ncbi:NAD(P)-dependent oxidoreductase [Clostridium estertheticum]|uniref:NAD-dependent epimerase/dehydratase family protein n=2 Tax=Clostridium estertheticum TaxID=238834 RepID=UPI00227BD130|nr:NAD(P)-dependent oxidoreductase [Clostridium estertheticum]WAG44150.1 NAD(P)-dependent oxidoreductase [Clostridium estertheticum]
MHITNNIKLELPEYILKGFLIIMPKKILITGGTGFIGKNIIRSINNENYIINIGRNKNLMCDNIFWNLQDNLDDLFIDNIDVIIHCASIVGNDNINKSDYIDINVKSTLELLEFGVRNKIKKFILISTGGVYGFRKNILDENDICNAKEIYSLSKYFSEELCELYKGKLSIVILRLFFPYGDGQKGRLIGNLFNDILEKNTIMLNKNGMPIINPIHIFDVVNIVENIIENDLEGIFNICGNEFISIEEICRKIAFIINVHEPKFIYCDNDIDNLMGSGKKICRSLNYNMQMNLNEGLELFFMSLKKEGQI